MPHDHKTSGHAHAASGGRAIGIAALITGTFMFVEFAGGLLSGSLALLADAGHMLNDFVSLVLAWFGARLAMKPADSARTYGYGRFSVLAAFVNGLSLFLVAGWICFEAYDRFSEPVEILGGMMLWVAIGGLIANLLSFWVLSRQGSDNLNIRAAILHVAGDLLGSLGALAASIVILLTGWTPIDPLLSVFVAVIILRSAWQVVKESGHILLEGAPIGFDGREAASKIVSSVPGIVKVEHIHAWSISQERPMVTLEVVHEAGFDGGKIKNDVKDLLREEFGMSHAIVELSLSGVTGKNGPG